MPTPEETTEQQPSFEALFAALLEFLNQSFRNEGAVSIPTEIIEPFRKVFRPTESSPLRDLQRLLDNGRPKNIFRLLPSSFYGVVSIVLRFPYSPAQNRLFYVFMDVIRQYRDEKSLAPILSRVRGNDISHKMVRDQRDYFAKKLSACVLRHLVSADKEVQGRWRLAQFLSVILWDSPTARNNAMEMQECHYLANTIEADQSHFVRILVADVVRELLYNGAERAILKKSCATPRIIDDFPLSKGPDSAWMSQAIHHLSELDLARAFLEKSDRVFRVQRLEYEGSTYFESASVFIATVSSELSFLIPNGRDTLTLFSIPLTKEVSLTFTAYDSESSTSTVLEIQYPGNDGYRVVNGVKSAIDSLIVTFCDEGSAEAFMHAAIEQRNVHDAAEKPPRAPNKQSVALMDMTWTSGDEESTTSLDTDTSQPGSRRSWPAAEMSAQKSQFDPARQHPARENPRGKSPSHLPAARASPAHNDPVQPSEISSSVLTPTRTLPKIPVAKLDSHFPKQRVKNMASGAEESADKDAQSTTSKDSKGENTMARLAKPPGDSQSRSSTSVAPAVVGLKRRALKEPAGKSKQSHQPSNPHSDLADYDLPRADDDQSRPKKKPRTTNTKLPVKTGTKDSAEKKREGRQTTERRTHHPRKEKGKVKVAKSPDTKSHKTAASTRTRRTAKTPKYVEESDESDRYANHGQFAHQDEDEDGILDVNMEESAEDSHPNSKTALESALRDSKPSFELNLRELVDTRAQVKQPVPETQHGQQKQSAQKKQSTQEKEFPPDKQTVQMNQATQDKQDTQKKQHTHEKRPTADEQTAPDKPSAKNTKSFQSKQSVPDRDPLLETPVHETATPFRPLKRLSGSAIPPVNEKLLRKTSIVHFGPEGPYNQAVSVSKILENTAVENETFGLKPLETKNSQPTISKAQDNVVEDGEPAAEEDQNETGLEVDDPMDTGREDPAELASDDDDQSSPDTSGEQEVLEFVASIASEGEEDGSKRTNGMHTLEFQDMRNPHTPPFQPRTPHLDGREYPCETERRKETNVSQLKHRRSIGISAILDEDYPEAERVMNTERLRKSLQSRVEKDANKPSTVSTARATAIAPFPDITSGSHGRSTASQKDNTVASQYPQSRLAPEDSIPPQPVAVMGPPPPRSVPYESVACQHHLQCRSVPNLPTGTVLDEFRQPAQQLSRPPPLVPVRVKRNLPFVGVEAEPLEDLPPATPISFCTRLKEGVPAQVDPATDVEESKIPNDKETAQRPGNGSMTLINEDESIYGDRSVLWELFERRRRSESTDGMSSMASPLRRNENATGRDGRPPAELRGRESQRGVLDAIIRITNDVLFRFGEEEDAVRAKVDEYHRGGDEVIQTLIATWNDKIAHEYRNLADVLQVEREVLTTATRLVGKQDSREWEGIICNKELAGKVQKKNEDLMARIQALMKH